jgi:hypothetical protein
MLSKPPYHQSVFLAVDALAELLFKQQSKLGTHFTVYHPHVRRAAQEIIV